MREAKDAVAALTRTLGYQPKAIVVTFGCQMNARDSEKLRGVLDAAGYGTAQSEEEADFVIYNTCTVRENADKRVYGRLGVLNGYKKQRPHMKIALCGCMMQEPSVIEKIGESFPFVDLIFGTFNLHRFGELLGASLNSGRPVVDIWTKHEEVEEDLPVTRKYPFKSGLNIMYGCDNFCSYCIVPYVRGRERSRRPKEILEEAKRLADDGVKEVMLLGQNVNSYGLDFVKETDSDVMRFPELLRHVCAIDGIERVRFMSSHPKDLTDELIDVMRTEGKIARHLHLALQSGSDRILERMNRHYTKASFLALADKIRTQIPDLALTTDLIVGFPGETDADVDDTIDVVRQVEFDNAFTFIYSKRTGTKAALFDDPVDEAQIHRNFDRLLKEVQYFAKKRTEAYRGRTETVLVEEVNEKDASFLTGRMSNNTLVHFKGDRTLIGEMVPVKLTECKGFYYLGEHVS